MSDYMKEAERLMRQYTTAVLEQNYEAIALYHFTLLAHIQRGAVPEGDNGKRVLREVFALCEDTEAKCSEDPSDFNRGRAFEAKGIARALGAWYQEEFCGRTHMGEPAAAASDLGRMIEDIAQTAFCWSAPAPAEVPMPEPTVSTYEGYRDSAGVWHPMAYSNDQMRTYGVACRAAGEAAGYTRGLRDAVRDANPLVQNGEVLVTVTGLTGSGKSAIAGEIEIMCQALGLDVEWVGGDAEKRLTHADWTDALEMYRPRIRIIEANISRTDAALRGEVK